MADQHEQERNLLRSPSGCTDPAVPDACLIQPPYRRLPDPCGDVVIPDPCTIDVTKFKTGVVVPDLAATEFPALPVVELFNAQKTARCSDLSGAGVTIIGSDVIISAGALQQDVSFSIIDGITDLQRVNLGALEQSAINVFPTQTALQIAAATSLTLAQATQLKSELTTVADALNAQAETAALAGLDCYYENVEQTATCANDGDGVPAVTGASNPVVVAAGAVRSNVSQVAANADALAQGQAVLTCVWRNDTQTANCSSGAIAPTFSTVASDSVTSTTSKADANAQALAQATATLVCRFQNAQQTVTCDGDADSVAANTGSQNPVVVAAGAVLSTVDVSDANAQALLQAQSALVCEWGNAEVTVECPDDDDVEASETVSPVFSYTVPANTILSTISRADANTQATAFAQANLDCRYCNPLIAAKCTTGDSDDETAEVPAGTFCESSFEAASAMAEALSSIPIKVQADGAHCRFSNTRVTAICVQNASFPSYLYKFTTGSGVGISPDSTEVAIIEAGVIVVTTNQEDAQTQAEALALASLNCFFESEEATFQCADDVDDVPVDADATQPFTVSAGAYRSYTSRAEANSFRDTYGNALLNCFWKNDEATSAACSGSLVNLQVGSVPAGTFTDTQSKASANAIAQLMANGLAVCVDADAIGSMGSDGNAQFLFVHPYKVIPGSSSGKVKVVPESYLFDALSTDTIPITGLNTDLTIGAYNSIYLHCEVADGEVTSAEIIIGDDPDPLTYDEADPPEQTAFRVLIAEFGAVPAVPSTAPGVQVGSIWVHQILFTNLRTALQCSDGQSALYPVAA